MKLLIINGPNINLLGIREPELYGNKSYDDLVLYIKEYCISKNVQVNFIQSNYEGRIIDSIQDALNSYDGIVINPAAYTHYSIAILDALKAVSLPTVEVHLSNINERESYRKKSVTKDACLTQISGYGFKSYIMAIDYLIEYLQ